MRRFSFIYFMAACGVLIMATSSCAYRGKLLTPSQIEAKEEKKRAKTPPAKKAKQTPEQETSPETEEQ